MKEYIVTVLIEYSTNIEAENEREAIEKARLYAGELDADTIKDIAEISIEEETKE